MSGWRRGSISGRRPISSLDEADAVVFANVKGPKKKDYLATAEAFAFVKRQPGYGSNARVASRYPVSPEIVREFVGLLNLPKSAQALIATGQLKLEHGRRLHQLKQSHTDAVVEEAASAMVGMSAHDARDMAVHLRNYPDLSVGEAKTQVLASKAQSTREFHVIALLDEPEYGRLRREAGRRDVSVDVLVTSVIRDWLEGTQGRA